MRKVEAAARQQKEQAGAYLQEVAMQDYGERQGGKSTAVDLSDDGVPSKKPRRKRRVDSTVVKQEASGVSSLKA